MCGLELDLSIKEGSDEGFVELQNLQLKWTVPGNVQVNDFIKLL